MIARRPRYALLLTTLALAAAAPTRADEIVVLPAAGGPATTVPGTAYLKAIGPGPDPSLTVERRTRGGSYPWVHADVGRDGKPRGRARPLGRHERRRYAPWDFLSPTGRLLAYTATDDRRRINRDTRKGPVHVEIAPLRTLKPRRVLRALRSEPAMGWAPDGGALWVAGQPAAGGPARLWAVDASTGRAVVRGELLHAPQGRDLSVGPEDGQVAYDARAGAIVVDLARGRQGPLEPAQVTHPERNGPLGLSDPLWSPTSGTIVAARDALDLELLDASGLRRTPVPLGDYPISTDRLWAPDGRTLAVALERLAFSPTRELGPEIHLVEPVTGATKQIYHRPRGRIYEPRWSPDGRWLAFTYLPRG